MTKSRKNKQSRQVKAQDDILSPMPSLEPGLDFQALEGREGFCQAKAIIKRMVEAGYDDVDIIIQLHEELPSDIAETALRECRQRGIL